MSKELEAKQLVPNKFWIVQNYGQKVGTLQKNKEGYILVTPKDKIHFENVEKVYDAFGHDFFESAVPKVCIFSANSFSITFVTIIPGGGLLLNFFLK